MTVNFSPKWVDVRPDGFYVYIHRRMSDNAIFYVGRGKGNRAWQANSGFRSPHWKNIANKHGVIVEVTQDGMSTHDADLLEEWLIAKFRHNLTPIINITDGGGGSTGWIPSEKTREKWSAAKRKPVINSNGQRFDWVGGAVEWLKSVGHPKVNQSSISMAANGVINQAYGYAWWYEGCDPREYITRKESIRGTRGRPVLRSDGLIFSSISGAAEYMRGMGFSGASAGNISTGITSGRTRYGFTWSYAV